MSQGIRISEEDKQALVDLVREEIEGHKRGGIDRLSTNKDLASASGMSERTVTRFISKLLDEENKEYRITQLQICNGNNAVLRHSYLPQWNYEQRIANYNRGLGAIPEDEKSRISKKNYGQSLGRRTLEDMRTQLEKNVSLEQRKINGSESAKICRARRTGLFGISPEKRRQTSKIAGQTSYKRKVGIHARTKEEMIEHGKRNYTISLARIPREERIKLCAANGRKGGPKAVEQQRKNAYFVEGRFYASSQQEGAVALLLEKCVPQYQIVESQTFQVRDKGITNGGIDFLVENEFLEWHPTELYHGRRGDIPSREEYESYGKVVKSLEDSEKEKLKEEYAKVLAVNYRNSRQEAVDNSEYKGKNVALATNVQELYDFISRYSNRLLGFDEFRREFNTKCKYIKSFAVKKENAKQSAKAMTGCAAG